MNEYQKIVDQIIAILRDCQEKNAETVSELNDAFSQAVVETNDRLSSCDSLLKKGRRTEAIQLSEQTPNLLDVVAILDIPEHEEWTDTVRSYSLNAPPELLYEIASDLNVAYTVEQPLDQLLAQNRLLALGKAPLIDRIEILRQIHEKDPDNPIWESDIQSFEKESHNQIDLQIRQAYKKLDVDKLSQLERLLKNDNWLAAPPPKLVTKASQAHVKARQKKAVAEMIKLEESLSNCFAELDINQALPLYERWKALELIAELPPGDELAERAAPAVDWVESKTQEISNLKEHEKYVEEINQAIENDEDKETLQELYYKATRFGHELPSHLFQRLNEKLNYKETHARRKFYLILASGLACVVLVGVFVGAVFYNQKTTEEIESHVNNLTRLTGELKLDEAEGYVKSLDNKKWVLDTPEFQNAVAGLRTAQKSELDRLEKFGNLLHRAQELAVNNPDWDTIQEANGILDDASKLTKGEQEKTKLEKIRSLLFKEETKLQNLADSQFDEKLESFKKQLKKNGDYDLQTITELNIQLSELKALPHVSVVKKTPLKNIETMLETQKTQIAQQEKRQETITYIRDVIGKPTRFKQAIQDYARQFPNDPRTDDFSTLLKEDYDFVTIPSSIANWNQMIESFSRVKFDNLSSEKASTYLEQFNETKKKNLLIPPTQQLLDIESYLEKISARQKSQNDDVVRTLINKLFEYTNILMVFTKDEKRFYTKEEPRSFGATRVQFKKFTDLNFIETDSVKIEENEIANDRDGTSYNFVSPQSRFAQMAIEKLNSINPSNWDATFVELVDALQNDKTMGPIVKYYLMKMVFKAASETSFMFNRIYEKEIQQFDNIKFDFLSNYVDPEDLSANQARDICKNGFSNMASFSSRLNELNELKRKWITPPAGNQYDWFGILFKDENKQFNMLYDNKFYSPENLNGDLYVIHKSQNDNSLKYLKIGTVSNGVFDTDQIDEISKNFEEKVFLEGKPVYLTKDPN